VRHAELVSEHLLALDDAVREGPEETEPPARFRRGGQPEMWATNIEALRDR
jgi:hypothetical protein